MKRESKRMSLGEATMIVERLSPKMDTCFLGGPENFHKTIFTEAFNHIVLPAEKLIKERIGIFSVGNGKLNVIEAPPGSGKTHASSGCKQYSNPACLGPHSSAEAISELPNIPC